MDTRMISDGKWTMALAALLLLMGLGFSSCEYGEEFKTFHYKTAEGEWYIDFPPYMRRSSYTYPGAEFQAANNFRDTYAFTRFLNTAEPADKMADSLFAQLTSTLEDVRIESDSVYHRNGSDFHTIKLTGMLKDKRQYYLFSVIESEYQLFHFSAWMFERKRELWQGDFDQMLHSFRR